MLFSQDISSAILKLISTLGNAANNANPAWNPANFAHLMPMMSIGSTVTSFFERMSRHSDFFQAPSGVPRRGSQPIYRHGNRPGSARIAPDDAELDEQDRELLKEQEYFGVEDLVRPVDRLPQDNEPTFRLTCDVVQWPLELERLWEALRELQQKRRNLDVKSPAVGKIADKAAEELRASTQRGRDRRRKAPDTEEEAVLHMFREYE